MGLRLGARNERLVTFVAIPGSAEPTAEAAQRLVPSVLGHVKSSRRARWSCRTAGGR